LHQLAFFKGLVAEEKSGIGIRGFFKPGKALKKKKAVTSFLSLPTLLGPSTLREPPDDSG